MISSSSSVGVQRVATIVIAAGMAMSIPCRVASGQRVADGTTSTATPVADGLARRVTVDFTNVRLDRAIQLLMNAAHVKVAYDRTALDAYTTPVTLHAKAMPLGEAFDHILTGTPLTVVPLPGEQFAILRSSAANLTSDTLSQPGVLTGVVTDSATGQGISSATVTVGGRKGAVLTSNGGQFSMNDVPAGEHVVTIKALGYRTGHYRVTIAAGDGTHARLTLAAVPTSLAGVVTTATGMQERRNVGNDITVLNVDSVMRTAPIATVTDLLEGRVPGLTVQRASGVPGAPSRIRVRGVSSLAASNDPIIIVDGVRTYSEQTSGRATNDELHSVIDNIDVHSIERVEVLKGPSASSLYGSDAANGVIVITTKRGRPGKTSWSFSTDQQRTTQPNTYSALYYRQGMQLNGISPIHCTLHPSSTIWPCSDDTLFVIAPLRNARTTILGTGYQQRYTANVSGGSSALRYFLGGTWSADEGLVKMSDADVAYLERTTRQSVPRWQRRPLSASSTEGTSQITMQVTPSFTVALTNAMTRTTRQETPYATAIGIFQGASTITPADTSLVTGSLSNFRQRTTSSELMQRNSLNADWFPWMGWNLHGDIGYEAANRHDRTLLRRGDCISQQCVALGNDKGTLSQSDGDRSVATLNLRASSAPLRRLGVEVTPSAGVQYIRQNMGNVSFGASNLALGSGTTVGAGTVSLTPETQSTPVQLGMFVNGSVALFDRIHTQFGTRVDASNSLGKNVTPTYPKLDFSYAISEEPFFPFKQTINGLRLRLAYGHSAVQPAQGASLRTYTNGSGSYESGVSGPYQQIGTLGNPNLRPERSTELEGGFDLDAFGNRLTLTATASNKISRDAFVQTNLPNSVGSFSYTSNLGSVRNTNLELQTSMVLVDRPMLRWNVDANFSRNRNRLESVAPDFNNALRPGGGGSFFGTYGRRYVVGYPITGTWLRPVISYADVNADGILEEKEIVRSDSSAFVGAGLPRYELNPSTQLGLFRGRILLSAQFQYQNGIAQVNQVLLDNVGSGALSSTARVLNDPSLSIDEQALVRSGYAALHTVSLLRFTSFRMGVVAPSSLTRLLRAGAMNVALEGRNLRLWTSYSGSDPSVTGSIRENQISDTGVLPEPRVWGLNVQLTY